MSPRANSSTWRPFAQYGSLLAPSQTYSMPLQSPPLPADINNNGSIDPVRGKRIKTGELWAGTPAKLMRELKPEEIEMIAWTADHYAGRAAFYRKSVEPAGR